MDIYRNYVPRRGGGGRRNTATWPSNSQVFVALSAVVSLFTADPLIVHFQWRVAESNVSQSLCSREIHDFRTNFSIFSNNFMISMMF